MVKKSDDYLAPHFVQRSNWLRAAVLGANNGILSTASLAIGIAASSELREPVVLATVAGLVAGALSMAAGEYVSVSSQTDIGKADIEAKNGLSMDVNYAHYDNNSRQGHFLGPQGSRQGNFTGSGLCF